MSKAMAVFSRNLLPFGIVTAIASLPTVLLFNGHKDVNPAAAGAVVLSGGLSAFSQAIVLYGAFEDMRGQPVDLMRSFQHASRRFLPVIGVAFLSTVLAGLASLLLIIPGLILFTAWYVAIPACVVERLGNLLVTQEGLSIIEEIGIKLHARSWFDMYKPPEFPHLPLDPADIQSYIESDDPLWQRTGYFARPLAKTSYRIHSQSARKAVRNLATLPMRDLQTLWIMV
jgi:hypothetical protein